MTRLAVVDRGRVLKMGTPAEFRSDFAGTLRIKVMLEPGASHFLEPGGLSSAGPRLHRWARGSGPPLESDR